ncbi:MAG: HAMP domain-containing protein [Nitrospirae bacterium]|nr:HAMP domain-containing protein [Nitrospirota bacterium]
MFTKLNNNILIAFVLFVTSVLVVGGISVYSAKDILNNTGGIEEESKHIMIVDNIHASAYRLILAIHHFIIVPKVKYFKDANNLLQNVEKEVDRYIRIEMEETYPEKKIEIVLLTEIKDNLRNIKVNLDWIFKEFSETGRIDDRKLIDLENFAYSIESKVTEINRVHFNQTSRLVGHSKSKMGLILHLYIVFSVIGISAIIIGQTLLHHAVIKPVQRLASATEKFADGELGTRVSSESITEIGSLYRAFNAMAEKLEGHERELRELNSALEIKIKKRTSELEQSNEELKKSQTELIRSERLAVTGQIAAGVTHEIRTPLNSLAINIQMLHKELSNISCSKADVILKTISIVEHEVGRINDVLEEFIRFAKVPQPKFTLYDVNTVIEDVVDLIEPVALAAKITVKLALNNIHPVRIDPEQIKQVLLNICQNSIQAMPEGGLLLTETLKENKKAIIRISDTGKGISPYDLADIFTPFFSTKESGLGLGLSIVQRIIDEHGGEMHIRSEMNKGTVFEITLPMDV